MNSVLADKKIVFLGAGNMAEAIVRGMLTAGVVRASQLLVTDIRPERLKLFRRHYRVVGLRDNAAAVAQANIVVLSVKPQQMQEVLEEIKAAIRPRTMVLSIAAGIRTSKIESILPEKTPVVRAMPNTPAFVGAGITGLCGGQFARPKHMKLAAAILGAVGKVVYVAESQMDAVTAISGSGPAYVFYFAEAMLRAARELGLDAKTARTLVEQTLCGAAALLRESGEEPGILREKVTSKGGTTAAALAVMEQAGVGHAIENAIRAAHRRSLELSNA